MYQNLQNKDKLSDFFIHFGIQMDVWIIFKNMTSSTLKIYFICMIMVATFLRTFFPRDL